MLDTCEHPHFATLTRIHFSKMHKHLHRVLNSRDDKECPKDSFMHRRSLLWKVRPCRCHYLSLVRPDADFGQLRIGPRVVKQLVGCLPEVRSPSNFYSYCNTSWRTTCPKLSSIQPWDHQELIHLLHYYGKNTLCTN